MIITEELYSKDRLYDTTRAQIIRTFEFDDESF
jgi:hypothetical protein